MNLCVFMWAFVWARAHFQTPWVWSPVCRVHGRVSGEGLVCTRWRLEAWWLGNWSVGRRGTWQTWCQILFSPLYAILSPPWSNLCDRWTWTEGIEIAEHVKKEDGREELYPCHLGHGRKIMCVCVWNVLNWVTIALTIVLYLFVPLHSSHACSTVL